MKNLNIQSILGGFIEFAEPSVFNRFFKHHELVVFLDRLPDAFKVSIAGHSVENRSINLIEWGNGPVKVFLWSQMHGDEATGTMALLDLLNLLRSSAYQKEIEQLQSACTLFLMPMVNPDGAARFTRRNAQQIDINRDFLKAVSPEARILKAARANIQPDFGFNLHDQNTLWSVSNSNKPATLSFLAPAFDRDLSVNLTRKHAMLVIADLFQSLSAVLPGQIGLFDDEYEPRAFGDNFQDAGTSTILIEAGGFLNDNEKQALRKYYFSAIFAGLMSIATKSYVLQDIGNYLDIPGNNKQIFHILIHDVMINDINVSIGINYDEKPILTGAGTFKNYVIQDIGDMDILSAYHVYQSPGLIINGEIIFNENANFDLLKDGQVILSFKNGILASEL